MKHLYILCINILSFTTQGQSIIGKWETIDDETKEKKAVIQIYKSNDLYFAKII